MRLTGKQLYDIHTKHFRFGERVRKIKGSEWEGFIVGTYSTDLTPVGFCVESATHKGSVQIYPASALEAVYPEDKQATTENAWKPATKTVSL